MIWLSFLLHNRSLLVSCVLEVNGRCVYTKQVLIKALAACLLDSIWDSKSAYMTASVFTLVEVRGACVFQFSAKGSFSELRLLAKWLRRLRSCLWCLSLSPVALFLGFSVGS